MTDISASDIQSFDLQEGGVRLSLLNYGAITRGWWVTCRDGIVPVVLGYADPAQYLSDPFYLGAIAGRVANRTGGGVLNLGGKQYQLAQNEGSTHLHGGKRGLNRRIWDAEHDSAANAVQFTYVSPDGEEGYPGTAHFTTIISLSGGKVTYEMRAEVDRPTPVNLAQHNYYNLSGAGAIWDHRLRIAADRMTPKAALNITSGEISPVDNTPYDFRDFCSLGSADPEREGMDMNLVVNSNHAAGSVTAELEAPNGLCLRMFSDQSGLQLYTGAGLANTDGAHEGQSIAPFHGVCLEPQGFPDAVNKPTFPSIIATPERPYLQKLTIDISEGRA